MFVLKSPKGKVATLIYLKYHFDRKVLKMSVGEKYQVHPDNWNPTSHRVRKGTFKADSINSRLDTIEKAVKGAYFDLSAKGEPVTSDRLRSEVLRQLNRSSGKINLAEFAEQFAKSVKCSPGTRKIYVTVSHRLKEYPGAKEFDDIGPGWFVKFQDWMENKRTEEVPNGYSANYIGKTIAYIKIFMKQAGITGLHYNSSYNSDQYKKPSEEADTIYLTEHELLKMYGIELPDYLSNARDLFMLGAFTGLRFSDFSRITPASLRDGYIVNRSVKTDEPVVIPIHWVVRQILTTGLPKPISNQKLNDYIKEVARKAGITETVTKRITRGGVREVKLFAKCDLVTTHTARRSFASNAFLNGIPALAIMKITGHRTEASFLKYIRISKEENARMIANHPFFNI